jgi:hypothetical protein
MANLANMSPQALSAWDRLKASWGGPLSLNSAYRYPQTNARVGGAKKSQHMHGNAFDVSTAGMTPEDRARLIQTAQASGFTGYGGYNNSLHFDVGPSRTWGPDYSSTSTPEWLLAALDGSQAVADDTMTALGLKPQGIRTPKNTESKPMIAEQPQARGLLDALGIQKMQEGAAGETGQRFYERDTFKDTAASLAQGFAAMGSMPALQKMTADISKQRTEQKARNKSLEMLSKLPNGDELVRIAQVAGPKAAIDVYVAQQRLGGDPTATRALLRQAEEAGLTPGTPEYKSFMLNAGGDPATYRALVMQAIAAGFAPGTPDFERFMASRGAYEKTAQTAQATEDADINKRVAEMTRNLPGLYTVVDQLAALADEASYTAAQIAIDNTARQFGQEPSKGALARAEYIAIVDNQILPLLRQTFGPAFTVEEGARLRATLGAENASPGEKKAILDAFIKQKQRDLLALGGTLPPATTDAPKKLTYDPKTGEFK